MKRSLTLFKLLLGILLGANFSAVTAAATLVNGDFTDGLNGWDVSNPAYVSVIAGKAVLREPPIASGDVKVDLLQMFTIPQGTLAIEFELSDLMTEPDNFGLPDFLALSLLDSMNMSLVGVVPTTTNFYIRDLRFGISTGEASTDVTLSPTAAALPLTIRLDVSALSASAAVEAKLLFELNAGGPDEIASLAIDGVRLVASPGGGGGGNPGAVPEPSSFLLMFAGVLVVAGHRLHRRLRNEPGNRC